MDEELERWAVIHAAERPRQLPIEWVRAAREDARHLAPPGSRYKRALWILGPDVSQVLERMAEAIAADEAGGIWRLRFVLGIGSIAVALGLAPWWVGPVIQASQHLLGLAEGGSMDSSVWTGIAGQLLAAAAASGVFTLLARKLAKAIVTAVPRSVWPLLSIVIGVLTAFVSGLEGELAVVIGASAGLMAGGAQSAGNSVAKDAAEGSKPTEEL